MSLRCLTLSWEYPPVVEGGLGRHVGHLAPGLVADGVDVHVLTRGDRPTATVDAADGVVVHRVAEPRRPDDIARFVAWVGRMNDHMLAAGAGLGATFDVVHGHDWIVAEAADRLAGRFGCPLVMTIHATEHGRHRGWVATEPQAQIHAAESQAVHGAQRLITCSEYMRGHLADVFGVDERRISVIPNGVDAVAPRPAGDLAAVRAGLAEPSERLILLAGRLVYEKGFQLAVEALPGLVARVGALRLVIAGAGIHEPALRAAVADRGLEERVTFLGWVDAGRLAELYAVADVCVVPSIYEPFGLVALEAMARGCPCVAADTGGLREVVPHGEVGLRFTTRDASSLAAMVERVLFDGGLRRRIVAAALEHVGGFDWAAVAARTAGVYRELCPARPPVALGSGQ